MGKDHKSHSGTMLSKDEPQKLRDLLEFMKFS